MPSFNLDEWWDKNVDPNLTILDQMYKEITKDAIEEVIKIHQMDIEIKRKKEENDIDVDEIDFSSVL